MYQPAWDKPCCSTKVFSNTGGTVCISRNHSGGSYCWFKHQWCTNLCRFKEWMLIKAIIWFIQVHYGVCLLKPERPPSLTPCFWSFDVSLLSGSNVYRYFAFDYLCFHFALLFQHSIKTKRQSLTATQKQKCRDIFNSSTCNPRSWNMNQELSTLDIRDCTQTY